MPELTNVLKTTFWNEQYREAVNSGIARKQAARHADKMEAQLTFVGLDPSTGIVQSFIPDGFSLLWRERSGVMDVLNGFTQVQGPFADIRSAERFIEDNPDLW